MRKEATFHPGGVGRGHRTPSGEGGVVGAGRLRRSGASVADRRGDSAGASSPALRRPRSAAADRPPEGPMNISWPAPTKTFDGADSNKKREKMSNTKMTAKKSPNATG